MADIPIGKGIATIESGKVFLLPRYGNRHGLVAQTLAGPG